MLSLSISILLAASTCRREWVKLCALADLLLLLSGLVDLSNLNKSTRKAASLLGLVLCKERNLYRLQAPVCHSY